MGEVPKSIDRLSNYFDRRFGVYRLGDVAWAHAVNSIDRLEKSLADPEVMFIETDIQLRDERPVIVHPGEREYDLTFEYALHRIRETHSRQGLKLDFKMPEAVEPVMRRLAEEQFIQPIFLNADVLRGPNAKPPKIDSHYFINTARRYLPTAVLSLGWTTGRNIKPYKTKNIDEALELARDLESVTFPVRAECLPESWDEVQRLTAEHPCATLTIWNCRPRPPHNETLAWLLKNIDPDRTFVDLVGKHTDPVGIKFPIYPE